MRDGEGLGGEQRDSVLAIRHTENLLWNQCVDGRIRGHCQARTNPGDRARDGSWHAAYRSKGRGLDRGLSFYKFWRDARGIRDD
jgi:hypothetical protein